MIFGLTEEKFWRCGKFYSSFFMQSINILLYRGVDIDYAEACIKNLNSPSDSFISDFTKCLQMHLFDSLNKWAEIDKREEIETKLPFRVNYDLNYRDFLKCLTPQNLSVGFSKDGKIGWQLELNCPWDPDDGIEIDVLENELIYFGKFVDNSPWDDFPFDNMNNYVHKLDKD